VVPIHCAFVEEEELWIVMPLLTGGSCSAVIQRICPNGIKDEEIIATILLEALKALIYFHKDGRIHRDVKAGNILLSATGEVQLADFGVACTLMEHGDRQTNRKTFTGTPCWMAPEVMEQTMGYNNKADIWSLGITALELAYGRAPYAKYQPMKVLLMTLQNPPPTAEVYQDESYKFPSIFHSFVSKCLKTEPSKRPTAAKLMKHKFFRLAKPVEIIRERLLAKLPQVHDVDNSAEILERRKKSRGTGAQSNKPVSVGSWVFDDVSTVTRYVDNDDKEDQNSDDEYTHDPTREPNGSISTNTNSRFTVHTDDTADSGAATDPTAAVEPTEDDQKVSAIAAAAVNKTLNATDNEDVADSGTTADASESASGAPAAAPAATKTKRGRFTVSEV
jgi:serine/threonine-protein kinase OSR1/STK39